MSKLSKRRRRQQLAAQTSPADPAQSPGSSILILPRVIAGIRVNEYNALTFSAVWACVKVITEDLAALPWRVYRKRPGGGRDLEEKHVVDWLLHVQANPETSAFTFRETLLAHALTWGNGYAEIERDGAGRPVWLWQLTPDRVDVARTAAGHLVYDIDNGTGPNTVLDAEEVFHLKGPSFDGIVGYNVVLQAAKTIGLGLALRDYGTNFFGNDATPNGALKHPGRIGPEATKNLRESWTRRHGGGRGGLAILEEGMDFVKFSVDNKESQYTETLAALIPEVCRIWRVPPHKIGDLSRSTFSNIEHQSIDYVTDCLTPWAVRLEQESNGKLFDEVQAGTFYTKHSFQARLRGDSQARAAYYNTLTQIGVLNGDEVRDFEEMNPIPGGDVYLINGNMTPRPETAAQPETPAEKPEEKPDAAPADAPADKPAETPDGKPKKKGESAAAEGNVQATALNGAQITSLLSIVMEVAAKRLPAESAKASLKGSFPLMGDELINSIIDPLADFVPPPEPGQPPEQPPEPPPEGEEPALAAVRPVVLDACRRVLRREMHRRPEVERRGEACRQEQARFAREAVTPAINTLCLLLGNPAPAAVLTKWAGEYEPEMTQRCQSPALSEAEWEQLAGRYAVRLEEIATEADRIEVSTNGQATISA